MLWYQEDEGVITHGVLASSVNGRGRVGCVQVFPIIQALKVTDVFYRAYCWKPDRGVSHDRQ